jgi:hypothetical protein
MLPANRGPSDGNHRPDIGRRNLLVSSLRAIEALLCEFTDGGISTSVKKPELPIAELNKERDKNWWEEDPELRDNPVNAMAAERRHAQIAIRLG